MGQPIHPNGARVNNTQIADNALAWWGSEKGFFFQSYLLSLLFKFIRHWLTASLVIPHKTPWYNCRVTRLAKLRSRKATFSYMPPLPDLGWDGNLPAVLRKNSSGRILDGIVIRYFRQLPPELVLRDAVEDLVRPVLNIRRPRYAFTFWNRPKLLRCTGVIFCILKGVGAGEQTPEPFPSNLWTMHVQEEGFWKEASLAPLTPLHPSLPYWRLEL